MHDFKPPIDNPWFLALCKWGLPLEMWRAKIKVDVAHDALQLLKNLKDRRVVLVCNHADEYDPEVTFVLSKILQEDFNFIAARECFDWWHGLTGWCFQNIGCYSVVRGEADLDSFATTKDILVNGRRKLVLHPEGEVTRQPDVIAPLRRGATRLFLDAQESLSERDGAMPLLVVPMAVRWWYEGDIMPHLSGVMSRIEHQLGVAPPSLNLADRVEYASAMMATLLEKQYLTAVRSDLPFESRIVELRTQVLQSMATILQVELPVNESHVDWLRRIGTALARNQARDKSHPLSTLQKRVQVELKGQCNRLRSDFTRMQHLIGISDVVDWKPPCAEHLALRISQLEHEILGKKSRRLKRRALIGVGPPISLLDYLSLYVQDRVVVVDTVTERIRNAMQSILDQLDLMQQKDCVAFLPK